MSSQHEFDVGMIANRLYDWREDFETAEDAARDIIEYFRRGVTPTTPPDGGT